LPGEASMMAEPSTPSKRMMFCCTGAAAEADVAKVPVPLLRAPGACR
jgi:hypothetical protein